MVVTREQFLEARLHPITEDVPVDGIGLVRVRGLRASEAIELAKAADTSLGDIPMLVNCVLGEDNKPLFTEADVRQLAETQMAALVPILAAIRKLSGSGEAEKKAPGAN